MEACTRNCGMLAEEDNMHCTSKDIPWPVAVTMVVLDSRAWHNKMAVEGTKCIYSWWMICEREL